MTAHEIIAKALAGSVRTYTLGGSAFIRGEDISELADSILTALREAGELKPQWRPIEEAPKDGTVFLLYDRRASVGIGIGHFVPEKREVWEQVDDTTKKLVRVEDKGFWNGCNGESLCLGFDTITHFQPLPPPPEKDE